MRLQSVEADSRRSSIPATPKASSPRISEPEQELEVQREITKEESQIEDYDMESMDESDENKNDFLSAIVLKKSHPDFTALESTLQGSREERLHKAGLQRKEQTSIPITQKEQTSMSTLIVCNECIRRSSSA